MWGLPIPRLARGAASVPDVCEDFEHRFGCVVGRKPELGEDFADLLSTLAGGDHEPLGDSRLEWPSPSAPAAAVRGRSGGRRGRESRRCRQALGNDLGISTVSPAVHPIERIHEPSTLATRPFTVADRTGAVREQIGVRRTLLTYGAHQD